MTTENAIRLYLAGQVIAGGKSMGLPDTTAWAAKILHMPEDQYKPDRDWPRVVAKIAVRIADAIIAEVEATK